MAKGRITKQATCEGCFFRNHGLCALTETQACTTWRPNAAEGLQPPTQLRFTFRQERRTRSAWAFPSAQEQAALYAAV